MSMLAIRPFHADDAAPLYELFHASIHALASRDYTPAELAAWAPPQEGGAGQEPMEWAHRRASKPTWVAERQGAYAGFIDLEPDGHIDMLYVHPDHARAGVARALFAHLLDVALRMRLTRLYAEASLTARPCFERWGFQVVRAQSVLLRGQNLTNFQMVRSLPSS
jgi:putative acetyltransferase